MSGLARFECAGALVVDYDYGAKGDPGHRHLADVGGLSRTCVCNATVTRGIAPLVTHGAIISICAKAPRSMPARFWQATFQTRGPPPAPPETRLRKQVEIADALDQYPRSVSSAASIVTKHASAGAKPSRTEYFSDAQKPWWCQKHAARITSCLSIADKA